MPQIFINFCKGRFFKIMVYNFGYNKEVYVRIGCFIILLFQDEIIHQIITTFNGSFMFSLHYMLASIFMLHGIAKIKC